MSPSDPPVFGRAPAGVVCRKRPAAYAVITDAAGRILVIRVNGRCWLPGGGSLPGEAAEATVVREVREELGQRLCLLGRIGEAVQCFHAASDGCWYEMAAVFFRGELDGEPVGPAEYEPGWLDAGGARETFFHASHAWAVARAGP